MRLSHASRRRYRKEFLVLLAKVLAIALPVGMGGIALIVVLARSLEEGLWPFTLLCAALLVVVAASLAVFYASETYIKPLVVIEEYCRRLRDYDFTSLEDVQGAGVMKEVAATLSELSLTLHLLLDRLSEASGTLHRSTETVLQVTESCNKNIQGISREVMGLAGDAERQLQGVSRVEGSTEAILEHVKRVERAAEEALAYAQQVRETVGRGSQAVRSLRERVEEIHTAVEAMQAIMEGLGETSDRIGSIIEVISRIADETRLLSLNAAIEAARAGEAGRGFSVVAGEVRRLAEDTAKATHQVEDLVNRVRGLADRAREASAEVGRKVDEGSEQAERSEGLWIQIDEVAVGIEDHAQAVLSLSADLEPMSEEVKEAIRSIAEASENVATRMQEVSASLEEQTAAIQEVTSMMHQLDQLAEDLSETIAKYLR